MRCVHTFTVHSSWALEAVSGVGPHGGGVVVALGAGVLGVVGGAQGAVVARGARVQAVGGRVLRAVVACWTGDAGILTLRVTVEYMVLT